MTTLVFLSRVLQLYSAQTCHELHTIVMRSIAVGLDLDEMYFEDKINEQQHNLRLLSYPSIKTSLLHKEGQARAGAHSGKTPFLAPQERRESSQRTQIMELSPSSSKTMSVGSRLRTRIRSIFSLQSRWYALNLVHQCPAYLCVFFL